MKEVKPDEQLNKGKSLVEIGLFLLLLNVLTAVHGWQMIGSHFQISGEPSLVEAAWVRDGIFPAFDPKSADSYYVYLIHWLFLFMGNNRALVPVINTILQILGVFFFYRGTRRLLNETEGLLAAVVSTLISIWWFTPNRVDSVHLLWFAAGLLLWLISFFRLLPDRRKKVEPVITRQEEEKTEREEKTEIPVVNLIPNPLPVPKKHVKKEMNYAFEPPKELMHYDYNNYRAEDDYDLKES